MERCGAMTQKGTPCQWPLSRCDIPGHDRWREAKAAAKTAAPAEPVESSLPSRPPLPEAVSRHDIPGVAWWALSGLVSGALASSDVAVLASLLRVLLAAGSTGLDDEAALQEVELRGLLMHGIPPRNDAEWEVLESTFSPEAVAEVRRWRRLLEADGLDSVNPGFFGDQ